MSSNGELERLIGTAVVDAEFRAGLLESPVAAASSFNLSAEELDALSSADASSLEDLAAHLYAWITKAPKFKRSPATRWTMEGYYHTAEIAV